jgi:hypothetical protein
MEKPALSAADFRFERIVSYEAVRTRIVAGTVSSQRKQMAGLAGSNLAAAGELRLAAAHSQGRE